MLETYANLIPLKFFDEGVGFSNTQGRSGSLGFNSMFERTQGKGDEMTIQSQASQVLTLC